MRGDRPVAGVYPYFGGDGIVLVESVDYGRDGGVARVYIERSRNVECARDRTPRVNSDLVPDKTLKKEGLRTCWISQHQSVWAQRIPPRVQDRDRNKERWNQTYASGVS